MPDARTDFPVRASGSALQGGFGYIIPRVFGNQVDRIGT